jgi:hypothetical protein
MVPPTPAVSERRAHPRHRLATTGSNPLVATVGIWPRCALVYDLSLGGISLLITQPPPVGSVVPVWLAGAHPPPATPLLVTIIYLLPHGDNLYRVGGQFLDESSAEVIRAHLPAGPTGGAAVYRDSHK